VGCEIIGYRAITRRRERPVSRAYRMRPSGKRRRMFEKQWRGLSLASSVYHAWRLSCGGMAAANRGRQGELTQTARSIGHICAAGGVSSCHLRKTIGSSIGRREVKRRCQGSKSLASHSFWRRCERPCIGGWKLGRLGASPITAVVCREASTGVRYRISPT